MGLFGQQPGSPKNRLLGALFASLLAGVLLCVRPASADRYDVVLARGRVMDPESGLDALRDVGIRGGKVAAISEDALEGGEIVDVSGLVVAPGFIDLHAHGQEARSRGLQARDGVTTALDMEAGVWPAAAWYDSQSGSSPIHYGASAGHIPARRKLKLGIDSGHSPTESALRQELYVQLRDWAYEPASGIEIDRLVGLVETGLREGALGVGLALQYVPGARREEVFRLFQLAARAGAPVFVHLRSNGMAEPGGAVEALQEALADAAASGAPLHVLHVTSMGLGHTPLLLEMIEGARQRGLDVTVEAYPYTAASTHLSSAFFDPGWQERLGISYGGLQWAATGERLTRETFEKYRTEPGYVIAHAIPEKVVDLAIRSPLVMIASDGLPFRTGGEHPRGAGTFARVLGRYVRERKQITLMDALRKMTLMPAERLEKFVPAMRRKGRLAVGADADVTVFDPKRVIDRATYEKPMRPSEGIVHVLVAGAFVVRSSALVEGALPGQPVRRKPGRPRSASSRSSARR